MKTGVWIGIISIAVILSLIVGGFGGSRLFPKEIPDKEVFIDDVEKKTFKLYHVEAFGYGDGGICIREGNLNIGEWDCFVNNAYPSLNPDTCGERFCYRWYMDCTCFKTK